MEMTNDTSVKYSMAPHSYKFVSTHAHEISGWKIPSRLIHSRAPNIGGMNFDDQSKLSTLAFNNAEQLKEFHSIIIILQQEIVLYVETVSPTIIIFYFVESLSKRDKPKALIAPNMTHLIT